MDIELNKVSVIIPCFNAAEYISDTIHSVLLQTHSNYEILIVDGGSTDGTVDILNGLSQRNEKIKIIHNENDQGPAHSRLLGIEHAIGQFIAFLDADDLWHAEKLEIQISNMIRNDLDFTFTDYMKIPDDGFAGCLV